MKFAIYFKLLLLLMAMLSSNKIIRLDDYYNNIRLAEKCALMISGYLVRLQILKLLVLKIDTHFQQNRLDISHSSEVCIASKSSNNALRNP